MTRCARKPQAPQRRGRKRRRMESSGKAGETGLRRRSMEVKRRADVQVAREELHTRSKVSGY